MSKITEQERFMGTLQGKGVDRFPFFDLEPDEETQERWIKEGLSPKISVTDTFGLETHHSVGLMLRSAPFYQMAPDLLLDPSTFDRHYDPDDPARLPEPVLFLRYPLIIQRTKVDCPKRRLEVP